MKRTDLRLGAESGFSLIEMLIVIAVIGVLAGIAGVSLRAATSVVYANSVRTMLLQSRFEAVSANVPIVVSWSAERQRFEAWRAEPEAVNWCSSLVGQPISVSDPADYGRLSVETDITAFINEADELVLGQLVWIPSGQARTCTNDLYGDVFAQVSDDRRTATVEVSFGGRVVVR